MASSTTESNDYGYVWEGSATGVNPILRIWVKGAEGLDDVAAVAFGMNAKEEVVRDTGVISSGNLTFDYVEGMFNCLCPFDSDCAAWKLYIWNRNENLGVRDVEWEAGENIPVGNIVDELNAVKQRAKDHTTNIVRALRVPEAGSDNLFVPPVEARKGKVLGFDDDGNPAVGNAVEQVKDLYEIKDTVSEYVDIAAGHAQSAKRSAQDAAKSASAAQGFAKEAAEHADRAEAAAEVAQSGLSKIEEAVADGINDIEQAASEAASKIDGDISDAVDRAEHAAQSAEEDAEKCEELFSKISAIEVKFDNIQCFVCCAAKQVENTRQHISAILAGGQDWVRANFVPLEGDFTTSGAGTFNGATTFGGEVSVLSGKVVRFRNGEGNTAVSMRFTDSPTGGVLNQGSASTTTAMTWMSGNYMSWFSSEFLRLYSGESVISPTAKIEANPNGVILAAGAGDAAKIVIDAGKIQVSGAPLTLNVAPTATNHATTKGYVDKKVAALEADYAKFEEGTSTAETGAKHGKSLLASQNGEDGGFYVGANRSTTRAWTQNMTRYRQTGVRAYGETTGKHEDYLWSPRTEEDEPLRVARLKDFAAMEAKIAALKERIEALEELPAEGYIRLRIETTEANQSFPLFYRITTEEGGYVSVDWGDGNTETLTGATTYSPTHTYATAGEYVVKLTGSKFTGVNGVGSSSYNDFRNALREILSLKMPKDSTGVSLNSTFYGCVNLTGNVPAWDDRITNAYCTYYYCRGLTGNIPAWGANITNAYSTYNDCRGLTGNIPAWGASITNARATYYNCRGLTGNIPAWGASITDARATYNRCSGLTGSIPAWGANITNASQTYYYCRGLTGNIPAWGANITDARQTYTDCRGLTGNIPAWGANITDAYATYYYCMGLTGCSEELLQDPMPSMITSHESCVGGCVDEIRKHFTPDWGGTKEELPGTGDIRLRIETTEANQSFPLFHQITTEEGGYVSVDWGDGNTETLTGKTTYQPEHTYATAGEYIVKLTGSKFTWVEGVSNVFGDYFQNAVKEILSLKMPKDSTSVSLRKAFRGCINLTGNIPEWDDCIVDAADTYYGCPGLTGNIPVWGANITNAHYTYYGCIKLTENIPAWGANITDASGTYWDCRGLAGCSEELLQDPMPSRITSHASCVSGCVDEIRQHFTADWGGTKSS